MSPVAKSRVSGAWVDSSLSGGARVAGSWVYFSPPSGGNPEETLFTTQTPTGNYEEEATILGTYFTPAVSGTITKIRWWFPSTGHFGGILPKAALFRTSDSVKLSGDVTFVSDLWGTWNEVPLTTPVSVQAGTQYCAAIWTSGRYSASPGGSSPWPFTNGNLSTAINAGRFTSGASGNVDFPSSNFNNGCYFVDVVFIAD
jgi:uncharacterized protein DUF4082